MGQIADFAAALWEPGDTIEVRMLPSRASVFVRADVLEANADLLSANKRGENVYFGANPRKGAGCKDADGVQLARCVFVDIDNCQNVGRVRRAIEDARLPAPTVILFSGGGYHVYWRLEEPMHDLSAWSKVQRGIIAAMKDAGLDNVDGKIHDAPRIMRAPGFTNHKRGVDAGIIDIHLGKVYAVDEFPVGEAPSVFDLPPVGSVVKLEDVRLAYKTMKFLSDGAPEGERNARLFAAACDLAGCGVARDVAERMLVDAGERCGLDRAEIVQTIESAWKKARTPSKPPEPTDEDIARVAAANAARLGVSVQLDTSDVATDTTESTSPTKDSAPEIPVERVPISNVTDGTYQDRETNKTKQVRYYRPIEEIAGRLRTITGGWPKVAGDTLFVQQRQGGRWRVRYLAKPDELFAWMAEVADVRWSEGDCMCRETKAPRTSATKGEFFQHLKATTQDRFLAVSDLPHEPPMSGYHYLPLDLPKATGVHLKKLVDSFNAQTEADRGLMLACLLTMFWGGHPGTRPGFIFDAESPGSGKSATVDALTSIAGGAFVISDPDQKWADSTKQMMSSSAANARAVVFDNVRKIVEGQAIESAITSPTVSGWRVYVGHMVRPNDVTVIVTANGAQASQDMATRLVRICVGRPIAGRDWVTWAAEFIEDHRLELVADCLAMLRAPVTETAGLIGDRFSGWQRAVLSRIPGAAEMSKTIFDRRQGIDGDAEKGEEIAEAVYAWAKANGWGKVARLTTYELYRVLVQASLWDETDKGKRRAGSPPDRYALRGCAQHAQRLTARWGLLRPAAQADGTPERVRVKLDGSEKTVRVQVYTFDVAVFESQFGERDTEQRDDIPV